MGCRKVSKQKKEWVQVQAITNGDYYINLDEGHNNPNIIFDFIIDPKELEVIVPLGCKTYEVFGDDYGKNPMRWFKCDGMGFYLVRILFGESQCCRCLDPGCLLWNDKAMDIAAICKTIDKQRKNKSNKQLCFESYRAVAKRMYGDLPRGSARRFIGNLHGGLYL